MDAAFAAVESLLNDLFEEGLWPNGVKRTPERFSQAWDFYTSGYEAEPKEVLTTFDEKDCGDGMVFVGSIPFYSLCEHHLAPFFGIVHFAYLPEVKEEYWRVAGPRPEQHYFIPATSRIVGLSKIPRLVEIFARRLQVQERLTNEIANAFMEHVTPRGCGCVIRARHLCLESRGIQKLGATTVTSALRGLFLRDAEVREEFFSFTRVENGQI